MPASFLKKKNTQFLFYNFRNKPFNRENYSEYYFRQRIYRENLDYEIKVTD